MITSIALATKTFDLDGHVYMSEVNEPASTFQEYTRRLTRMATLDTGAYIDDRGYFDGDRTVDISLNGDKAFFESLLYLIKNYSSMWIFLPDGAYTGNMQRLQQDNGLIRFSLLLETAAT
jgi:hypothetical protein